MDSTGHDALSAARARVLRHGPEGWVLEVERLEYIDGSLYRPARTSLLGRERILGHLEHGSESPEIRRLVEEMIDKEPTAQRLAFHLSEEGLAVADPTGEDAPTLSPRVRKLEAQVRAMSRTVEQLMRLERRLSNALQNAHRAPPARSAGDPDAPREGARAASAGGQDVQAPAQGSPNAGSPGAGSPAAAPPDADAAPAGSAEGAALEAGAAPAGSPDAGATPADSAEAAPPDAGPAEAAPPDAPAADGSPEAGAADAPDAEEPAAPSEPKLALPEPAEWSKGLATLLGETLKLTADESGPALEDAAYWICPLVDDEDALVGAILGDIRALVLQGGGLMMMGDEVLKEQLEAGEPSEDVLEAASEIFNVQSRCFNDIDGNPHVRTKAIAKVDPTEHDFLRAMTARRDLVDENQGRTVLVSL